MSIAYTSTGVKYKADEEFTLYPNPVTDILYISSLSGSEQIHLYNQTGILVKVVESGKGVIDMRDLSSGVYLVTISGKQGLFKQVIVKK
jgi:hypothetical protein